MGMAGSEIVACPGGFKAVGVSAGWPGLPSIQARLRPLHLEFRFVCFNLLPYPLRCLLLLLNSAASGCAYGILNGDDGQAEPFADFEAHGNGRIAVDVMVKACAVLPLRVPDDARIEPRGLIHSRAEQHGRRRSFAGGSFFYVFVAFKVVHALGGSFLVGAKPVGVSLDTLHRPLSGYGL